MKRTIVLLATLLLSFGLLNAQGSIDLKLTDGSAEYDTLWSGFPVEFEYWMENTTTLGGMSVGFHMYSADGATWTWGQGIYEIKFVGLDEFFQPIFDTIWKYAIATPGGPMDPPGDVWDLGGLQLTEDDFDGLTPDLFLLGGVAQNEPVYPAGGPAEAMNMFATFGGVVDDNVATVCIDTIKIGEAGDFVFAYEDGSTYIPAAWDNGSKCWPIKIMPNMPPSFVECPTVHITVDHCGSGSVILTATDLEEDPVHFDATHDGTGSVGLVQAGNQVTVTYTPGNPGDVGNTVTVTVFVGDAFTAALSNGGSACDQLFDVTNNAPSVTCPLDFATGYDNPVTKMVVGADADACDNLVYSVISTEGSTINPTTGEWSWTPAIGFAGPNIIEVEVTDGYETVSCDFEVEVLITVPFEISIQKTHGTLQGHFVDVMINMDNGSEDMGGFDFLIGYDNSALTFIEAIPGEMLLECGWEYFTYRYNWNGNCGNACPSGLLRVVAMAEINDGPNHPLCTVAGELPRNLVNLKFLVSNDRTFECMYVPIRFYWMDCGDNGISSPGGDTLYVSKAVYEFEGGPVYNPGDYDDLPGWFGAPDICLEGDKVEPVRFVYFTHGGVDIICSEDIDGRGDINANGVMNEIADAVMFTNYFINGLSAFGEHVEASIAASDVNADGTTLSVADLVYLIRVIIGDANAYPKPLPGTVTEISVQSGVVSYNASHPAGAGLFVFDINGEFSAPELLAEGMDMTYGVNNDQLRVLVYNIGSNAITAGDIISVKGDVELVEVEMANYDGDAMETAIHHLPTTFALAQNYPNPFNPKTTIQLSLPQASEWNLTVFNIAGQKVNSYSGTAAAGTVDIVWDGTDSEGNNVASGIYFYKATANNFSQTMKMVLMK